MIEIFNVRKIASGSIDSSFSIRIKKWKDFCIHNLVYFKSGTKDWVSFPANKVEKNGQTSYYPFCCFPDKQMNDTFRAEILKAFKEQAAVSPATDEECPF